MKVARIAFLLAVSAFWLVPAFGQTAAKATKLPAESAGVPVNGLQMSIALLSATVPSSLVPAVNLRLRNINANEMSVVLGAGCGSVGTNFVILSLRDSTGRYKELRIPPPAGCAGAGGVLRVALPQGAERSVPLDLGEYREFPLTRTPGGNGFARGWKPGGTYTLQAEFAEFGPTPNDLWQGIISSNELRIRFPRR